MRHHSEKRHREEEPTVRASKQKASSPIHRSRRQILGQLQEVECKEKLQFDPAILTEFFSTHPDIFQCFVDFENQYQRRKAMRRSHGNAMWDNPTDEQMEPTRRSSRHKPVPRRSIRRDESEDESVSSNRSRRSSHHREYCDCECGRNSLENRIHHMIYHSPFTPRIRDCSMPRGFEFPKDLKAYTGDTDPDDFLDDYVRSMRIRNVPNDYMAKALPAYLTGYAMRWFRQLADRSINSYEQLAKQLATRFFMKKKFFSRDC